MSHLELRHRCDYAAPPACTPRPTPVITVCSFRGWFSVFSGSLAFVRKSCESSAFFVNDTKQWQVLTDFEADEEACYKNTT